MQLNQVESSLSDATIDTNWKKKLLDLGNNRKNIWIFFPMLDIYDIMMCLERVCANMMGSESIVVIVGQ